MNRVAADYREEYASKERFCRRLSAACLVACWALAMAAVVLPVAWSREAVMGSVLLLPVIWLAWKAARFFKDMAGYFAVYRRQFEEFIEIKERGL